VVVGTSAGEVAVDMTVLSAAAGHMPVLLSLAERVAEALEGERHAVERRFGGVSAGAPRKRADAGGKGKWLREVVLVALFDAIGGFAADGRCPHEPEPSDSMHGALPFPVPFRGTCVTASIGCPRARLG